MRFWVGGYSADLDGAATGIGRLHVGEPESPTPWGALAFRGDAVAAASPSWLTAHPGLDVVYAALEGAGAVQAFRRSGPDTLTPFGDALAVGELPCHVAVAPDATHLVVSCWGDGGVVRIRLDESGRLGTVSALAATDDPYLTQAVGVDLRAAVAEPTVGPLLAVDPRDVEALIGRSADEAAPDAALAAARAVLRAAAGDEFADLLPAPDPAADAPVATEAPRDDVGGRRSRAHQAVFLEDGLLATIDMGFDLVRFWRRGTLVQEVALPRGSGPRHAITHPSGHLHVVTELSAELFALAADRAGTWRIVSGVPVGTAGDLAAEIVANREGTRLYAGLRGSDTIAVLGVGGAGERVEPLALVEAGAAWPRHHVLVDDTLLVAGQRSDSVTALVVDERTGVPGRARARVEVPAPTMLLRAG